MDSNSVLRSTVAAVIAAALTGGVGGVARAGESASESARTATGEAASESASESAGASAGQNARVTHLGVWTMRAAPEAPRFRAPAKALSKAYAFRLVTRHTWSGEQFQCLDSLWTRESNWDHRAYNSGSGAYGIPQALPGDKMGYVARDWRFNPQTQIRWGLRYIKGRYGSPCGAWGHFRSHNWY
ncbi:lytic transglycosylase domain-containing protein [Microbispora amethystogenes]|uniref:aggregation-promoting factor C-terminal-like domain-containing protein n=1 Tax=Microbispora amethystogenes TaxID=1427754 RepID=UPI0033DE7049